jgi:hypothetical protein
MQLAVQVVSGSCMLAIWPVETMVWAECAVRGHERQHATDFRGIGLLKALYRRQNYWMNP